MQRPGQDMVKVTWTCVILISIKGGESQGVQTSLVKTFKTKNIKIVTFDDNKSNQVDNQIVILQIDAYYGLSMMMIMTRRSQLQALLAQCTIELSEIYPF